MHHAWELPLSAAGVLIELDAGLRVRIRPVRADDRDGLYAGFERFSQESRYYRFFTPQPKLSDAMADRLLDIDHHTHLAWAVFDADEQSEVGDPSGLAVAVARLIVAADDPLSAEASLAVVDDYQRRGIGRFLIDLLAVTAADLGMTQLRFVVLNDNRAMRAVLAGIGATSHRTPDDPSVLDYVLDVPSTAEHELPAGALYGLLREIAARQSTVEPEATPG